MTQFSDKHIVIAGGGTGGHLFPGLAVIEAMRAQHPDLKVTFVGTERGIEARVIPELGYPLELLDVTSLKGNKGFALFQSLSRLPVSGMQSLRLLKRLQPDIVMSVGGYAAGPFTMAAALRGVPTVLMEQNAVPGVTNKLLGKVVKKAFVTFDDTCVYFPRAECVVTGNPVRDNILRQREAFRYQGPGADRPFRILIVGGSGGAQSLNVGVPDLLASFEGDASANFEVRHQTGRGRAEDVEKAYKTSRHKISVHEFIDDMAEAYQWCDLLICRAGASTIAEVLALGIPAIYVPFPHAADNHQEKNALAIVEAGAGMMIGDDEVHSPRSHRLLKGLLQNPQALYNIAHKARSLGRPYAGNTIAESLFELLR